MDAARGMVYLHSRSPPVIHRDLKGPNLMVDSDWHVKVRASDLQTSRHCGPTHPASQGVGPALARHLLLTLLNPLLPSCRSRISTSGQSCCGSPCTQPGARRLHAPGLPWRCRRASSRTPTNPLPCPPRSKFLSDSTRSSSLAAMNPRWLAPEVMQVGAGVVRRRQRERHRGSSTAGRSAGSKQPAGAHNAPRPKVG